jgi:predicted GNAT family N-acyltransferase
MGEKAVFEVSWEQHSVGIKTVRTAVFIEEQGVSQALEFDGLDLSCSHWLAFDPAGQPIGTARMLADGHIGRMAVLADHRQRGLGKQIMETIIASAASYGHQRLHLHAQLTAVPFYSRLEFAEYGVEFMDAGMAHIAMELQL